MAGGGCGWENRTSRIHWEPVHPTRPQLSIPYLPNDFYSLVFQDCVQPWLFWNLLCKSSWPWRQEICLPLLLCYAQIPEPNHHYKTSRCKKVFIHELTRVPLSVRSSSDDRSSSSSSRHSAGEKPRAAKNGVCVGAEAQGNSKSQGLWLAVS